jgi:formate/nitrite transporter FocA (FNT family)
MTQPEAAQPTLDALVPPDMAPKAGTIGVVKMDLDAPSLFALAVLAGAFIALGAIFATTVTAGAGILPFGVTEVLGGIAFCLGLILVIGAGTELFTGNNLIVMAGAGGKVSTSAGWIWWVWCIGSSTAGRKERPGIDTRPTNRGIVVVNVGPLVR